MRTTIRLTLLVLALACGSVPAADTGTAGSATLAIGGGVERPLNLDADQLRKRPPQQIVVLQLPGKDGDKPGTVRGVRLRDLLDEAKIVTRDHNTVKKLAVIATGSDGYKVVFSWSELFNASGGDSVLVLFERDGKPLGSAEGPLALIAGQDVRTGPRHVKFLQSVEVRQIVD